MMFLELLETSLPQLPVQESPEAVETRCCDCWEKPKQCPLCAYIDKKNIYKHHLNDHTKLNREGTVNGQHR